MQTILQRRDGGHSIAARHTPNSIQDVVLEIEDLIAEEESNDFSRITEAVTTQKDIRMLFEVPGMILAMPDTKVAVMLHAENENGDMFFILHEDATGSTIVLLRNEIPAQAEEFIASYANVLACMTDLNKSDRLH